VISRFAHRYSLVLVSFQSKQGMLDYHRFSCQTAADQKRLPKRRIQRLLLWRYTASNTPEFRGHHTNTEASPNEQAGISISEQPLAARVIGSLSDK
jgi:hypothetical protein